MNSITLESKEKVLYNCKKRLKVEKMREKPIFFLFKFEDFQKVKDCTKGKQQMNRIPFRFFVFPLLFSFYSLFNSFLFHFFPFLGIFFFFSFFIFYFNCFLFLHVSKKAIFFQYKEFLENSFHKNSRTSFQHRSKHILLKAFLIPLKKFQKRKRKISQFEEGKIKILIF